MTILEKVDALRSAELLAEIRTESLARLATLAEETSIGPNQTLFVENRSADEFFLLLEGEARTLRQAGSSERHGPGALLGLLDVLAEGTYRETAVTAGKAQLLRIAQDDLIALMGSDFNLTRGLLKRLVQMFTCRE